MRNVLRATLLGAACAAALSSSGPWAHAQSSVPEVLELRLTGVVDPFMANYIRSGIEAADSRGATAVLLAIDTPGGLDSSMRQIIQAILNSDVPVIGYVSPEGARAASAGAFILIACPVAAMAPATNVGAAHPVGVSGAIESQKAENDAAEYIVSLAERRGRNAEWAERAVRESVSASAQEALELGVIDRIALDVRSLLAAVDGRSVEVGGGRTVVLRTAGASVEPLAMGWVARLLHALLDPNIAFILFYLGLLALYFELVNPGLGVPAVVGVVLLVTAFLAFGMLPVQLAGVILLVASAVFFAWEVHAPGIGVPLAGGVVTLILGGLLLFDTSVPGVRVSPLVIAPVAASALAFFGIVVRAVVRVHRQVPASGPERMVGAEGTAAGPLRPHGVVQVASEEWSAESVAGNIPRGARVRVVGIEGLRLRVERVDDRTPAALGGTEGSVE
ncbi:MAG TPA: nodulation protein NfeD [Actinomycetota bacterium]